MRCKNLFNPLRKGLAIFLMLALGLYFPGLASAAGTAIVSVSAPSQTIDQGEILLVSIVVDPNAAIAGMQFDLSFDPSLVSVDSVEEGDLLAQDGAITYFDPGVIDNEAGTITGAVGVIISPGQTVSTIATFALITLTVRTTGVICPFTLSNVIVGDSEGNPVPVNVISGEVTIGHY